MVKGKSRATIPAEIAARILFLSDRTCCVCRVRGKPVQIHHVNEDPSNNELRNLAVLCLECHRETQLHGGFDRKLDADQVILYRDDWQRIVAQQRAADEAYRDATSDERGGQIELATSVTEIYRENQEYELLAKYYNVLGNYELRDKYVELAIEKDGSDQAICYLRGVQGRPDLIPRAVIERESARYTQNEDWSQRARFYFALGKHREAVADYTKDIAESLKGDNVFSAAYYLKELANSGLVEELFVLALKQASEADDLWWQVRALQELGWRDELRDLVLKDGEEIERSNNLSLQVLLAEARDDAEKAIELRKAIARVTHMRIFGES